MRKIITGIAVIACFAAARADEKEAVANFVQPLISGLVDGSGDVWEGSEQGGYLFRFFFDVNQDGGDEMFLMSSTFPNQWKVYSRNFEGGYSPMEGVDYFPIPATGFESRSEGGTHEIILASLEGSEIVQTKYRFNGNAINIETERVDASKWEPRTESLVVPQIEKVFLAEYLNDPSTPWQPVDLTSKETVVTGAGYYSFPSDRDEVARWKQFSPKAAMELLDQIAHSEDDRPAMSADRESTPLPVPSPKLQPSPTPTAAAETPSPSGFPIIPAAIVVAAIVAVAVFLLRRKSP